MPDLFFLCSKLKSMFSRCIGCWWWWWWAIEANTHARHSQSHTQMFIRNERRRDSNVAYPTMAEHHCNVCCPSSRLLTQPHCHRQMDFSSQYLFFPFFLNIAVRWTDCEAAALGCVLSSVDCSFSVMHLVMCWEEKAASIGCLNERPCWVTHTCFCCCVQCIHQTNYESDKTGICLLQRTIASIRTYWRCTLWSPPDEFQTIRLNSNLYIQLLFEHSSLFISLIYISI